MKAGTTLILIIGISVNLDIGRSEDIRRRDWLLGLTLIQHCSIPQKLNLLRVGSRGL
jgi:hypothetical protein